MERHKNIVIDGKHGRPIGLDVFFETSEQPLPIVVFAHGFKGYKDWGCWDLVAEAFANAGFLFVKFNFSHNGGTIEDPIDFPDLQAFGQNNYQIELDDLGTVLDFIKKDDLFKMGDTNDISLIGHSRGGGICVLGAAKYGVQKLITWASVADFVARIPHDRLEEWKEQGVLYAFNGRTEQNMPMYHQFYEVLMNNRDELDIGRAAQSLNIPTLIVHGENDEAVGADDAQSLHQWISNSELFMVPNAGHTFGSKQPWEENSLPADLEQVVNRTIAFCAS